MRSDVLHCSPARPAPGSQTLAQGPTSGTQPKQSESQDQNTTGVFKEMILNFHLDRLGKLS